jgi:hypothetical protein
MCNHVILSAVKRSETKSKDPVESIEDHPSGRLDFARHDKQIAVAEQNPKLYILDRHNEI